MSGPAVVALIGVAVISGIVGGVISAEMRLRYGSAHIPEPQQLPLKEIIGYDPEDPDVCGCEHHRCYHDEGSTACFWQEEKPSGHTRHCYCQCFVTQKMPPPNPAEAIKILKDLS